MSATDPPVGPDSAPEPPEAAERLTQVQLCYAQVIVNQAAGRPDAVLPWDVANAMTVEVQRLRAEVAELRRAALRDAGQPAGTDGINESTRASAVPPRSPWEGCSCTIPGSALDVGELDPACPRHGAGRSPAAGAAPADYLDYLDSSYEVPPPSMCDATLISERDRVLFECDLRRGHDVPHTDKGCRWTTLPPTAPVPDPEAIDRAARAAVDAFNTPTGRQPLHHDPGWWEHEGPSWRRVARAVAVELGLPAPEKETDDE